MTALAAVAAPGAAGDGVRTAAAMLDVMRARGQDGSDVVGVGDVALGVAWNEWQDGGTAAGARHAVAHVGACTVIADATLYYVDDLRRTIGSASPAAGATAAHLVAAAYDAAGDRCAAQLEGDFAFVLWDEQRHRLLAARDFGGKRSLYFAHERGALVIASTMAGVLADARVPRTLSLPTIAAVAAGLWVNTAETCHAAVSELRAGHVLTWEPGRAPRVERFWLPPAEPPPVARARDASAAAMQLRELLVRATTERMAPRGPTFVSLSGGWDSTAVFGAGKHALQAAGNAGARELRAVSISYPEGDPGREDELITSAAAHWRTTTNWVRVDDVPMFADPHGDARARSEPWAHPFEQWNRSLSRVARAQGARVILDGSGGDQLFQISEVYLSDLFRRGHWVELGRQWRARRAAGANGFLRAAVRPAVPPAVLRALGRLRGTGEPQHYLHRTPPAWIRQVFLTEHGVFQRERDGAPALPRSSAVLAETHAYLLFPYFPRVASHVFGFALDEGVELRSPILDARVVAFAASRPWHERADGAETKVLLRRAMHGLLPDALLAPREKRTGITSGYFNRSLQGPGRRLAESLLDDPILASVGLVNPATLRRAWEHYLSTTDDELGVRLYFTLQTELWLREHGGAAAVTPSSAA